MYLLLFIRVKAKKGNVLSVHYVGTLYKNNEEFDSSRERNEPIQFKLGEGNVIQGWDVGLPSMCKNEIRKLTIPADLAYGKEGAPPKVHPDATLVFEIELVDILNEEDDAYWDYYEASHFNS